MKNKIKNISIEFVEKTKIEETYKLFKPFLHGIYNEIFFKELILEGDTLRDSRHLKKTQQ